VTAATLACATCGAELVEIGPDGGRCRAGHWTPRADFRPTNPQALIERIQPNGHAPKATSLAERVKLPASATLSEAIADAEIHQTDLGNARRLVLAHGADLRYCKPLGGWFVWDGRRWRRDDTGEVVRRAKATVTTIYAEGLDAVGDRREALIKHALRSESEARIAAMIGLAESEPAIAMRAGDFDRDPWLLNVQNGTIDLRTGARRPHRREDLITKLCPVAYAEDSVCLTWGRFLRRAMRANPGMMGYLQKLVGLCLTGDVSEKRLPIVWGPSDTGKTTFTETVMAVLGDDYREVVAEATIAKTKYTSDGAAASPDIAKLRGVRLAVVSETGEATRLNEARVKALTGRNRLTARHLHRDPFTFDPTHKLLIETNHKPIVEESGDAVWNRVDLIPFTVVIPPEEQDKALPAALLGELPGILGWAIQGCLRWQVEGLGRPPEVADATAAYRAEMDRFGEFLDDRCDLRPDARTTTAAIYAAYRAWCLGLGDEPMTSSEVGSRLRERGFEPWRDKSARGWTGLRLRPNAEDIEEADRRYGL
jgi:putative DNA primase/helicase